MAEQVDRVKHLEMVEAIVQRMASNSFLLKGWSITLAAALIAVATKEAQIRFAILALLPVSAFWGLDAFYLRHERLFRCLYDWVRKASAEELHADPYVLTTMRFRDENPGWFRTLWSTPVAWFHLSVMSALAAVILALTHDAWFPLAQGLLCRP
jgi:hypothetical protein